MSPFWKIYIIIQDEKSLHAKGLCESEWQGPSSALALGRALGSLSCRPKILGLIEVTFMKEPWWGGTGEM